MATIALICPEPIRRSIQGIGIRFVEAARELGKSHDVCLWVPNEDIPADRYPEARPLSSPHFGDHLKRCDAVVVHGHVSEHYFDFLDRNGWGPGPPLVVDLYDPFLVENLQYTETLGEEIFFRDRRVLLRQLERGDFFLASSEAQRLYYIGILTGMGRFTPAFYHRDPTLRSIIAVVPFGVHPAHADSWSNFKGRLKGVVPGIGGDDVVVFFGGVYDWYDPMLLLRALENVIAEGWHPRVIFSVNPNQETTPQKRFAEIREFASRRGWVDRYVFFLPWFSYEERFHYLRDVDIAVCLHHPSLETDLSLRTRLLDTMNAGIPIVATEGGEGGRILGEAAAGLLVPPGDVTEVEKALRFFLESASARADFGDRGRRWVQENMSWPRSLAPLKAFCNHPRKLELHAPRPCSVQETRGPAAIRRAVKYWLHHGTAAALKRAGTRWKWRF